MADEKAITLELNATTAMALERILTVAVSGGAPADRHAAQLIRKALVDKLERPE